MQMDEEQYEKREKELFKELHCCRGYGRLRYVKWQIVVLKLAALRHGLEFKEVADMALMIGLRRLFNSPLGQIYDELLGPLPKE